MKANLCMIALAMAITYVSWMNCGVGPADYVRWHQEHLQRQQAIATLEQQYMVLKIKLAAERRAQGPYPNAISPALLEQVDRQNKQLDRQLRQAE